MTDQEARVKACELTAQLLQSAGDMVNSARILALIALFEAYIQDGAQEAFKMFLDTRVKGRRGWRVVAGGELRSAGDEE